MLRENEGGHQGRKRDEATVRTQKAKALISIVKRGGMRKDEIKRIPDEIFGT